MAQFTPLNLDDDSKVELDLLHFRRRFTFWVFLLGVTQMKGYPRGFPVDSLLRHPAQSAG